MKRWHQALLGLLACALTPTLHAANPCTTGGAPSQRDGSGQSGTGWRPSDGDGSGQGGTGFIPGDDGSGSGGTGLTVEVDGVITGFASICVNGLELHYVPTTLVTLHGRAATPKELAVGQVVRALARGQGDQLAVQRVQVRHLLVATIQGIKPGELRAQGRTISLSPNAERSSGLTPGVKVAVSGFVDARGHSVATRLDVVPGDTPDSLTGEVTRNAQGELSVDGVVLKGRLPRLEPGDTVRAEGHFTQGRMHITRIEREERNLAVDRIVIQGSIRHVDKSGLSIGGQRFLIDNQMHVKQALPSRASGQSSMPCAKAGASMCAKWKPKPVRGPVWISRHNEKRAPSGALAITRRPPSRNTARARIPGIRIRHQNTRTGSSPSDIRSVLKNRNHRKSPNGSRKPNGLNSSKNPRKSSARKKWKGMNSLKDRRKSSARKKSRNPSAWNTPTPLSTGTGIEIAGRTTRGWG